MDILSSLVSLAAIFSFLTAPDAPPAPSVTPPVVSVTPVPTDTPAPTPEPTLIPTNVPTRTPTPTRTPSPIPPSAGELDALFTKYAGKESVDGGLLRRIAVCESGLNPGAMNGPYGGMFQFSESAWKSTRIKMNLDPDPLLRFHPEEAIKTAAYKLAINGRASWPNCSK